MLIKDFLKKSIEETSGKLFSERADILVEHPIEESHGDYATSLALQLSKKLNQPPMEVAKKLIKEFPKLDFISKIEIVKPGFINFWLSNDYLSRELEKVLEEKDKFGGSNLGHGKIVVIDYSAPNIAKPFGVGHLRSTIIGQAIYNIYKFLGWKTIGDNHLGDWGTQFGKLIYKLKDLSQESLKSLTIKDLEKFYVEFHKELETNPSLEEEARKWFKKLEDGNLEAKRIWQTCINVSLKEFNRIYGLLGVKIDYAFGESFYQDKMSQIIKEAENKKIANESEGALVIKFPEPKTPPLILLKSDGGTTYATRDLACIKYRKESWHPDLYIYEVGADQTFYFKQLFVAAVKLGFGSLNQFIHVGHGLIRLSTGKMSTRKGQTVYLDDVLSEAIERAKQIIEKSNTGRGFSKDKKEKVAKAVGIGAVKYFDLMHHHSTDIIFDWEKMFVLEGNSAPYIQYTYARCLSVLEKAGKINKWKPSSFNPEEIAILRTFYKFPEVVFEASETFVPNLICNFLFELAQKYNLFYNRWPILRAESKDERNFRLTLTAAVGQVIKNGLGLLGIETLNKI